jgi:hypothetical protein
VININEINIKKDKKKKSLFQLFTKLIGNFFVLVLLCVTIISILVFIAYIFTIIFENPISLTIICLTILFLWLVRE